MSAAVRYEVDNGVAWVTIDRPEAHNALNAEVRAGLFETTHRFNADDEAKVLVLTGAGDRAFSAGGDLKEMAAGGLRNPGPDFLPQFGRNVEVVKPTIAAVNGVAYAGGFLLAQMCDLCIASDSAKFAISEMKVGRGAPWATPLSLLVGERAAMEILLTGDPVGAERAERMGLVNQVVPAGSLRAHVQQLAERIAANAPLSVAAAKVTARLTGRMGLDEAFAEAERIWDPVYQSADAQEGPRAFRERRLPVWAAR